MPGVVIPASPFRGGFAPPKRTGAPAIVHEDTTEVRRGDRAARRALVASVIGLATLPLFVGPAISFYSFCVLVESGVRSWRMSGRGNLMYYTALVIDAATFVATGYALSRN